MARPIPMQVTPRDPREDAVTLLREAPAEHAEAILAAYDILQGLQDHGVLDLLQGLIGSSEKVTEIIVEAAKTPLMIRCLRNLMAIFRALGEIDPELFDGFAQALPEALDQAKKQAGSPPGLLTILSKFRGEDMRRGLVVVNSLIETWGRDFSRDAQVNTKE